MRRFYSLNLQEMVDLYIEEGLTRILAEARVCQDIVLKAIASGPLNRNVTIVGAIKISLICITLKMLLMLRKLIDL